MIEKISMRKWTVAGIDIGTNALRLLIAEVWRNGTGIRMRVLHNDRRITRLGEGIVNSGRLSPSAIRRTLEALRRFRAAVSKHSVDHIITVATSAVREAGNRRQFLNRVLKETGLKVEVIPGEEEARRTVLGVRYGLKEGADLPHPNIVIMDIGGGSTEWIVVTGGKIEALESVEVGVVKLTERYLSTDPPSGPERRALIFGIREAIGPAVGRIRDIVGPSPRHDLVGTAGTVTTLAALELGMIKYDPSRVQNMSLGRTRIEEWLKRLLDMKMADRRGLPGIEKGREDIIIAGIGLLLATMEVLGVEEVLVSDFGLREGILVDWMARHETN